MARNYFQGKYMDGTFSKGEGPVLGQTSSGEKENSGLLTGGEGGGKSLSQNSGPQTMTPPTPGGDNLFSLRGKNYAGPENWVPENVGETNPFEINS